MIRFVLMSTGSMLKLRETIVEMFAHLTVKCRAMCGKAIKDGFGLSDVSCAQALDPRRHCAMSVDLTQRQLIFWTIIVCKWLGAHAAIRSSDIQV